MKRFTAFFGAIWDTARKKRKGLHPHRRYRLRWVCPPWLKKLLPKKKNEIPAVSVEPAAPAVPAASAEPAVQEEGVLPLQPSARTLRLSAMEQDAFTGAGMRMVDLSGRIVALSTPDEATDALNRAESTLSAFREEAPAIPPMPSVSSLEETQALRSQQVFLRDGVPLDDSQMLDRLLEEARSIDEYDDMAMLRPATRHSRILRFSRSRVARRERRRALKGAARVGDAPRKRRGLLLVSAILSGVLVVLACGTVVLWKLDFFDGARSYVTASEIYFDGHPVGAVAKNDEESLRSGVDAAYEELRAEYGVNVLACQPLEVRPAQVDPRFLADPEAVVEEVRRNIELSVSATVISIDGMTAVALESKEDADWILDRALEPYQNSEDETVQVDFLEDVEVAQEEVDYSLLKSKEEAFDLLTVGVEAPQTYTVASGDSLWSIAEKFGFTINELKEVNPALSADATLHVGQELALFRPQRLMNVASSNVIVETEVLPHETETQQDTSKYTDYKEVKQEGKDGEKQSTIQINYVNGTEVSRTVLKEEILSEPVTEIVVVGTQKRPSNVSSSGYMRPVSGGRVTSPFGPRRAPTAGASTYHYGVDIGVGSGTAIVASKSGTVTSAGWNGGYGYMVEIDHGGGVRTRYAHCSSILVRVGQKVSQGQTIARVGSTGVSTGPHLHFEVRIGGTARNPANYVNF